MEKFRYAEGAPNIRELLKTPEGGSEIVLQVYQNVIAKI